MRAYIVKYNGQYEFSSCSLENFEQYVNMFIEQFRNFPNIPGFISVDVCTESSLFGENVE